MVSTLNKILITLVALGAVLYQQLLHGLIFHALGHFRHIEPLSSFPYQCRRLTDPNLHACEDMWLHEPSRLLFLACGSPHSRTSWQPAMGRLNASGRGGTDHIIAMDIDKPNGNGYDYRILPTPDFPGNNGDGTIDLVGISGVAIDEATLKFRLWAINHRPPLDPTAGTILSDASTLGSNSTVEVFDTNPGATSLFHVKTFADPIIATPNRIAAVPDDPNHAFYLTNDKGQTKTGLKHDLSPFYGGGDVSYCSGTGPCEIVSSGGYRFPNGLMRGSDGLVYVPSAIIGGVTVLEPHENGSLRKVHQIHLDYPIDNLSQDDDGDIFAAVFPRITNLEEMFDRPLEATAPSAVWRIRKVGGGGGGDGGVGGAGGSIGGIGDELKYEMKKIIEDKDGYVLPFSTTAVHDVRTGRLFLSGVVSPFITLCEETKT